MTPEPLAIWAQKRLRWTGTGWCKSLPNEIISNRLTSARFHDSDKRVPPRIPALVRWHRMLIFYGSLWLSWSLALSMEELERRTTTSNGAKPFHRHGRNKYASCMHIARHVLAGLAPWVRQRRNPHARRAFSLSERADSHAISDFAMMHRQTTSRRKDADRWQEVRLTPVVRGHVQDGRSGYPFTA